MYRDIQQEGLCILCLREGKVIATPFELGTGAKL